MGRTRRFLSRTAFEPSPVVTDNYFNLGFALLWLMYALWGVATIANDLPSLNTTEAPSWALLGWKAMVCLASGVASFGALFLAERVEFGAVFMFITLLASYTIILVSGSLSANEAFTTQAILSLSFLVMPLSRLRYLSKRIKGRARP